MHQIPDFDQLHAAFGGLETCLEMAACHGALCAYFSCRSEGQEAALRHLLKELSMDDVLGTALQDVFPALLNATHQQIHGEDFALAIWLPSDEAPLTVRLQALAEWCAAYLAVLGKVAGPELEQLAPDAAEALQDIYHIAQVALEEDSEEAEIAFTEITEYLRVAVLLIFESLQSAQRTALSGDGAAQINSNGDQHD